MKKILLFLLAFSISYFGMAQKMDKGAVGKLLAKNSAAIGMSADELSNYIMSDAYTQDGIDHVYLTQSYKGLPVYNQIRVLAFRNGEVLTSAGGFVPEMAKATGGAPATAGVKAAEAVGTAFTAVKMTAPASLKQQSIIPQDNKLNFGIVPSVSENVTAELLWVPVEKGNKTEVRLAWEIQVVPQGSPDWWVVQVDAKSNTVIAKYNRVIYDQLGKTTGAGLLKARNTTAVKTGNGAEALRNNFQAASPNVVADANYLVIPYPYESPRHAAAAVRSNPWANAPGNATTLGWHSNGTTDYTITRGNNVWATEDQAASNSNTGNPATSTTSTSPLNFNFPPNFTIDPTTPSFQNFAVTNLFYWNNNMHDMMYQYGFTEVSRNYQNNNQGRGGAQGDDVAALAQSGAGTNNANFLPGSDGTRGRMRMYLFDPASLTILHINAPTVLVGDYNAVESNLSASNLLANVGPVTAPVAYFNDDAAGSTHFACGAPTNSISGKIALINRGNGGICTNPSGVPFTQKILNAQAAGAVGVIMINNVAGNPIIMGGGPDNTIVIPAIMVSQSDGALLVAQAANGLNATMSAEQTQSLDGDLDAGVMCHEYGHGVSNRLTGTGTGGCLSNAEEGGEGWSDYMGLMMTTNWATAQLTDGTKPRGVGTYVIGQLPSGGGIRNYPYSTDITVNPLTYANMATNFPDGTQGEVHDIGEIWCMAIWEMTWGIINQEGAINTNLWNYSATSNGGNTIALKLVIEGMKLQPCSPGFIDARNGILAADRNLYAGKHACAIWTAFAKRGMGYPAAQGSSNNTTDQTASTAMPPAPTISAQPGNTSVASGANATFTAGAGSDVNLIYQWQVSTNGGGTWNDVVPAVITPTLTLTAVTCAMNNNQYRAIVRIGCLSSTTNAGTLTVTGCTSTPSIALTSAAGTNNQTVCINTPITNIVYTTSGGVTGASITAGALPAGVTGTYSGGVFTISGTPTAAGTFNYTVTTSGGTGPAATATGTIIVNPNVTLTLTSAVATTNQTVAINTPITTITYSTANGVTGATVTGLPAGVTGTYSGGTNGTVTISGTPTVAGTFNYTVTTSGGCSSSVLTGTIVVSNGPSITLTSAAGTNAQTVCVNTAITNIVYTTGGGATGASITAGALPAGVTGVYSGGTNGTFTISGTPTAAGTFSYTVTTSGGTGPAATATGTITVNSAGAISLSSAAGTNAQTVCANNAITNITYATTGGVTSVSASGLPAGVTGTFASNVFTISGTPTATGTFNYTVTTVGCGTATATGTITVNPGVTVTLSSAAGTNAQTKCVNTAITNITYTTTGGVTNATVSGLPAGVTGTYSGGTNGGVTISGTPTATGTFNYSVTTTGGCAPVTVTGSIIVNPTSTITLTSAAGTAAQTVCINTAITNIAYTVNTGVTGVTVTAGALPAGVTGTYASGVFTISGTPTAAGTFNYTVSTAGGCGTASLSGTITVNPASTISLTSAAGTNAQTVCSGAAITSITYAAGNGATGATVTGLPTGVTGTYAAGVFTISGTPSVSGTFNYTVTTSGGCGTATATGSIIATGGPVITTQPVSITSCTTTATFTVAVSGGGLTYQWQVSTNGGGTWTNLPGQTTATLTLTGLTAAQAANLYRVVITSSCGTVTSNSVSAQVGTPPVVLLTAAPSTQYNPSQGGGVFASVSPVGNYTYQWKRDGQILPVVTSSITAANGLLYNFGTYQVTAIDVNTGCSGVSNLVSITDIAFQRDQLFIWPNPASNVINLSYYSSTTATQARTVTLFDSKGARVMTKDFSVTGIYGTMTLDISKMIPGTYNVMLTDESGKKIAGGSVVKP